MKKGFLFCFLGLMACSSTNEMVDMSLVNYSSLSAKSKIVQKPTLIKLGIEPLKIEESRPYMMNLFRTLLPELEKTNITYQMAGPDIILTIQSHILLDSNMNILDSIKPQLDNMIFILTQFDRNFIEITGHTSSVGPKSQNLIISKQMASSVAKYFLNTIQNGKFKIIPERLFVNGMGENMWIADNSTREGQLLNHRIEIRISPLI